MINGYIQSKRCREQYLQNLLGAIGAIGWLTILLGL